MKKLAVFACLAMCCVNLYADNGNQKKVKIKCRNPGSHQDVAKTPEITNNTRKFIPGSVKIFWTASDGDKGFVMGPLGAGQSKSGLGDAAGNNYTCEAFYWVNIL